MPISIPESATMRPAEAEDAPGRGLRGHEARAHRNRQGRRRRPTLAGVIGYAVLLGILGSLVFGPAVAPRDPYTTDTRIRLQPPSWHHWLGTDELGRDILSRLIHGLPLQLAVSLGAVIIAATGGTVLGLLG